MLYKTQDVVTQTKKHHKREKERNWNNKRSKTQQTRCLEQKSPQLFAWRLCLITIDVYTVYIWRFLYSVYRQCRAAFYYLRLFFIHTHTNMLVILFGVVLKDYYLSLFSRLNSSHLDNILRLSLCSWNISVIFFHKRSKINVWLCDYWSMRLLTPIISKYSILMKYCSWEAKQVQSIHTLFLQLTVAVAHSASTRLIFI